MRTWRRSSIAAIAAAFACSAAVPAVAGATTYCVPAPCSPGTPEASIQAAFDAAAGDATLDTIRLSATTLTGAQVSPTGTATDAVGNPVDIVGAGQTQTIVNSPPAIAPAIDVREPSSSIRDLQIALAAGDDRRGLWLRGSSASNITVTFTDAAAIGVTGVGMDQAATLSDSTVAVPETFVSVAVTGFFGGGAMANALIEDSTISGPTAVRSTGSISLRRVTASGKQLVLQADDGTSMDVQDSVVRLLPGPPPGSSPVPPAALVATNFTSPGSSSLEARNVTLVGSGDPSTAGAVAYTDGALGGNEAVVDIQDSIIRNFANSLFTTQAASGGAAKITTDFSNYDAATNSTTGGGTIPTQTNRVNVDPQFVSSTDFHLLSTSPMIDAGTPGALLAGESPTDRDGVPRLLDGNGDCAARRDMGAFEFSPSTFAMTATATPPSALPGQAISFQAVGCDPDPLLSPTYQWSFDDGAIATGANVSHGFSSAGTHSATVTVTDTAGRTATASVSVVVANAPDTTSPQTRIRRITIRHRRHSATFRFSSSEAHSTFLCKLDRRRFRPCRSPKAYRNLRPGRHTFKVKARDGAGNVDQTPAVRRFRIRLPAAV